MAIDWRKPVEMRIGLDDDWSPVQVVHVDGERRLFVYKDKAGGVNAAWSDRILDGNIRNATQRRTYFVAIIRSIIGGTQAVPTLFRTIQDAKKNVPKAVCISMVTIEE